jgi:8-oxo-dGTP pyrophosphatase MutT (NUDIX family)
MTENISDKSVDADASLIPAATVLIVRDTQAGLEVFMVVRHHQIDFASGALVFPGGKIDKPDFDPAGAFGLTIVRPPCLPLPRLKVLNLPSTRWGILPIG